MKTFFAVIGVIVAAMMVAGMIGVTDFRMCIGAHGTCNPDHHDKPATAKPAKDWEATT